jgi:tetrahydromethanopterin S-methyltransferase subunit B
MKKFESSAEAFLFGWWIGTGILAVLMVVAFILIEVR